MTNQKADPERGRLRDDPGAWKRWGPYLAERAWGTVREDYSPDGSAWEYFPHDVARSRAFRWSEDGLAGICDDRQLLCFALAFWNGRDPILKERVFGLTGNQGNHGEDPKEYWWFLDSTPTHSWMRWRYVYPQAEFPYGRLVEENARRGRTDPEFELLDTGVFDEDRYWDVQVTYAKASPEDVCIRVSVRNAGPEEATMDVLPTLWFRNTWSWDPGARKPRLRAEGHVCVVAEHQQLGTRTLAGSPGAQELVFCENETNAGRVWGVAGGPAYPKDGINDHVVHAAATVNPDRTGSKAAFRYHLTVPPGQTVELRFRLSADGDRDLGSSWERAMAERRAEADAFYARLTPEPLDAERNEVMRQAFAGMLWSKQFFHYDVERWLDGDPAYPRRVAGRAR